MNLSAFRRQAWRAAGAALSPIRYRRRPDPYRAFERLPDAALVSTTPVTRDARILVLPVRVSSTSNLIEGVIGAALRLDGHEVHALLDGGSLRYSENVTFGKSWFVANALSVHEQYRLCEAFGLQASFYDDNIDRQALAALRRQAIGLDYDGLVAMQYRGVPIGRHARYGLTRYLRQETVDLPENTALLREFVDTALRTALAVEQVVSAKGITHAFLSHGIYSTWGVATDLLAVLGVEVSVWGRGYVGGNPVVGRGKSYLKEAIEETREDVERMLAPYDVDHEFLENYFNAKGKPGSTVDVANYYDGKAAPTTDAVAALLDGEKTVVSVFPNIPWDGTMFAASDYTPTLRAFAGKVVSAAVRFPDIRFVVRCHPAERHRTGNNSRESFSSFYSEADRRTPNLTILESDSAISSYDLLPRTSAAFVFGTTMGLELAYRGIPVIQTGRHHLSSKGAIFQVASDAELDAALERARSGQLVVDEAMLETIRRYAYYHVRLVHVQDDMIVVNRYAFEKYRFDRVAELAGDQLKSCAAIKRFVLGQSKKCLNPYVPESH